MNANEAWMFLTFGYVATVAIELPILYFGLHAKHSVTQRLSAGFLLTAFTYPMVVLVFPVVTQPFGRLTYLAVAETFAPIAEVAFFRLLIDQPILSRPDRDAVVITLANILSFVTGEAFLGEWILGIIRSL